MKLGINQFTLLKRVYPDKRLFVSDVRAIYNMANKRYSQKEIAICEKLVNRGYLKCFKVTTCPSIWWELTAKGKATVEEGWE